MPDQPAPDQKDRIEYLQKVLTLVKKRDTRFKNAQKRRALLASYVSADEELPPGPARLRLAFIHEGAQKVIHLLGSLGETFNAAYNDDVVTIADLLDILATAQSNMRAKLPG